MDQDQDINLHNALQYSTVFGFVKNDAHEVFLETALEPTCATDRIVSMRHLFCRRIYQLDEGRIVGRECVDFAVLPKRALAFSFMIQQWLSPSQVMVLLIASCICGTCLMRNVCCAHTSPTVTSANTIHGRSIMEKRYRQQNARKASRMQ